MILFIKKYTRFKRAVRALLPVNNLNTDQTNSIWWSRSY